jgi:hypothetical protein
VTRWCTTLPLMLVLACGDKDDGSDEGSVGGGDDTDGGDAGFAPTVNIDAPADGATITTADTLLVELKTGDEDEDDLSVLDLTWAGPAEGLGPTNPQADGSVSFTLTGLTVGTSSLSVQVTDPTGLSAFAAVAVTVVEADGDGDGYDESVDCDDADADVNPGATEVCNDGVDDDCDGLTDDEDDSLSDPANWYADTDADGYGDASVTVSACVQPSGHVSDDTDCDDTRPDINPGATEVCDSDDTDEDCDGLVNEDDDSLSDAATWYPDADTDGYGDAAAASTACDPPTGHVSDDADCDDTDAAVNPGATEVCNGGIDDDCDGLADDDDSPVAGTSTWYADSDTDGYGDASATTDACVQPSGTVSDDTDCDDTDAAVSPAATEICDSADTDEDCDGLTDDADSSATGQTPWYADTDTDGYGDAASATSACDAPSGHISDDTDCDDTDAAVNPAATEVCNSGVDDDCDGLADDDDSSVIGQSPWYADTDTDGYGDSTSTTAACTQPSGTVSDDTDCDDTDAAVNPAATELCDADDTDEDCDGLADDDDSSATGQSTWYADADTDGYGDAASTSSACDEPSGHVSDDTDCDDTDAAVSPAATEVCNSGVDDDCDGLADDDDSSVTGTSTWYADADIDGYGDATSTTAACTQPSGTVSDDTDCDDTDAAVSPADAEVCDAADVDEDCDGLVDDADSSATGQTTWYADTDTDGYGDAASTSSACDAPTGHVGDDTDCDDTDIAISPGATEICNSGVDDDCDGLADDDDTSLSGATDWYTDGDGDGYGDEASGVAACVQPSGTLATGGDCDDTDTAISPAATEVCGDGVDNDCDGGASGCGISGTNLASDVTLDTLAISASPDVMWVTGDQDGDGIAEVLLADQDGGTRGKAWLLEYDGTGIAEVASFVPNSAGELFGSSVASGDLNGDGYTDYVVGDERDDTGSGNAGSVFAWFGPVSGAYLGSATADVWHTGYGGYDLLGYSTAVVDVNHDGYADLISSAADAKRTPIWLGPLTATTTVTDYYSSYDTLLYIYGAEHMERIGDVNGDGYDDLASAGYEGSGFNVFTEISTTGAVRISGAYHWSGRCSSAAAYCSYEVSDAGDVNGDGYDDLLAQNQYTSLQRAALLFYGPLTGSGTTPDAAIESEAPSLWISGLGSVGDEDGDGYDDIHFGCQEEATWATRSGAVYVMHGPLTGTVTAATYDTKIMGDTAYDYLGWEIVGGHDFTGDGANDIYATGRNEGLYLFEGGGL